MNLNLNGHSALSLWRVLSVRLDGFLLGVKLKFSSVVCFVDTKFSFVYLSLF